MKRIYYLNNKQTRWVVYTNNGNNEKKEFTTKSGKVVKITVQFYEHTCYGVVCAIKHKGKLIKVFADAILED